ncbi:hypothetical protein N0V88_003031 [Collariella sp. IMI 366227]|nr:hypothetical protein N0V88_003031 [Collariella sp. IMI 366227]
MLPLGLLNAAQGHPMLVELKNGETLNGHLVLCDTWMNLTLREVVQTSPEGDKFVRLPEVYVKGNNIKYLRVPDEIIDIVKEQQQNQGGGYREMEEDVPRGADQSRTLHASSCRLQQSSEQQDLFWELEEQLAQQQAGSAVSREPVQEWPEYKPPPAQPVKKAEPESGLGGLNEGWVRRRRIPRAHFGYARQDPNFKRDGTDQGPFAKGRKPSPAKAPWAAALARHTRSHGQDIAAVEVTAEHLSKSKTDFPPQTLAADTRVIYEALRLLSGNQGDAKKIRSLVRYLVEERGERPNAFLYEALAVANWDPQTGSAGELVAMMREMKDLGILPTVGFNQAALRLLAIHPDYLTRNKILQRIKAEEMELSWEDRMSVALGLLRDGQTEMAMDYFDMICERHPNKAPEWLLETFVYVLTMRGFVDDAVQLIQQRLNLTEGDLTAVALSTWLYLLDECSRDLHYHSTMYIWENLVQPGMLNPPDGVCLNVLNTAARHGDPALATSVIELLSERKVKLGSHHYEPLVESHARAGDLKNAFQSLWVMTGDTAGINSTTQASTRAIFSLLKASPERADEAVSIITELGQNRCIPAAVAVVLEALGQSGAPMSHIFDIYYQLRDLPIYGVRTSVFKALLQACQNSADATTVISEMERYSVAPLHDTLDHLIRCFANDGTFDMVMLYIAELTQHNPKKWLSEKTLTAVLDRGCTDQDVRVWQVLKEAEKRGMKNPSPRLEKLRQDLARRGPGDLD